MIREGRGGGATRGLGAACSDTEERCGLSEQAGGGVLFGCSGVVVARQLGVWGVVCVIGGGRGLEGQGGSGG